MAKNRKLPDIRARIDTHYLITGIHLYQWLAIIHEKRYRFGLNIEHISNHQDDRNDRTAFWDLATSIKHHRPQFLNPPTALSRPRYLWINA